MGDSREAGALHQPAPTIRLCLDDIREVTRFAVTAPGELLTLWSSDDPRPREAVEAARTFARGGDRTNRQRRAAVGSHRAAREAPDRVAFHIAMAAGDACASAYLHPLGQATQVAHILRSTAHAACARELREGSSLAADRVITDAVTQSSPLLRDILSRYPRAPRGRSRVATVMNELDEALRRPPQDQAAGRTVVVKGADVRA